MQTMQLLRVALDREKIRDQKKKYTYLSPNLTSLWLRLQPVLSHVYPIYLKRIAPNVKGIAT